MRIKHSLIVRICLPIKRKYLLVLITVRVARWSEQNKDDAQEGHG